MFITKKTLRELIDRTRDKGLDEGYKHGYQAGQVERGDKEWGRQRGIQQIEEILEEEK